MKVQIKVDPQAIEPVVTITCKEIDDTILKWQEQMQTLEKAIPQFIFYRDELEYYFPVETVLFFETSDRHVYAHQADEAYRVSYKLYELEKILPQQFLRISKSTIINVDQIFSIDRNFTSYHLVGFYKSHKQVYVSRFYYQDLKQKLNERR